MKNLRQYFYRTDGDGHDYFIPVEQIEKFDYWNRLNPDNDDEFNEFYKMSGDFTKYMVGGSIYHIPLWIDPKELK